MTDQNRFLALSPDPKPGTDVADRELTVRMESGVFEALSSTTARSILSTVYESPKPPSRIAEGVGTSIQTVTYHLDRLDRLGLIEQVGSQYSPKGREMTVYGPSAGRIRIQLIEESGSEDRSAEFA